MMILWMPWVRIWRYRLAKFSTVLQITNAQLYSTCLAETKAFDNAMPLESCKWTQSLCIVISIVSPVDSRYVLLFSVIATALTRSQSTPDYRCMNWSNTVITSRESEHGMWSHLSFSVIGLSRCGGERNRFYICWAAVFMARGSIKYDFGVDWSSRPWQVGRATSDPYSCRQFMS